MLATVMASPLISIIIVNWNGIALLGECIQSLKEQTFGDYEIILVDNGSSDGSVEWVRNNHPQVQILPLKSNKGFSAGNNAGLKIARGKYVALLNNDTKVESGWLESLYKNISSDDNIAACDSLVLYYDQPELIWSAGGLYSIAGSVSPRLNHRLAAEVGDQSRDVFVAVACAAIYRKKVIDEIGFFDEDFFTGYEDVDWSFRALLSGYRIVNEPTARVYHKVSSTQIHNSPGFVYNGQRNVSIIFIKNMPGRLFLKYLPLHLLYALGSFLYFIKVGRASAFCRAKLEVVLRILEWISKRRSIQAERKVSAAVIESLLEKEWINVKVNKYRKDNQTK